jgi:hypothetical protein
MRQYEECNANVIVDNFRFREPRLRIERLGEICAGELLPFDVERELIGRVGDFPAYALVPRHTSILVTPLEKAQVRARAHPLFIRDDVQQC